MKAKFKTQIPVAYSQKEHEFGIRYGLGALKGVGTNITEEICKERQKNGPFTSIFDFCKRMDAKIINKKTLESLSKAGCFDKIHKNRRQIAESFEILTAYSKSQEEQKNSAQASLFGDILETEKTLPKLKQVDDWLGYDRFQAEFDSFGFYLKNHPLDTIKQELIEKGIVFIKELEKDEVEDGCTIHLAGVIINTTIKSGPKGRYAYITISDPDGLIELSLFNNDMITQHKDWLDDKAHNQLVFTCIVRKDEGGTRVSAKDFMLLDDYIKNTTRGTKRITKAFKKRGDYGDYKKPDYEKLDKVEFFKNNKEEKKVDPILASKFEKINKIAEENKIEKPVNNDSYNFFENKPKKLEEIQPEEVSYYKQLTIYITDENELEQFYNIISQAEKTDEFYTEIELIITDGYEKKRIILPNNFAISSKEIAKLRFNTVIKYKVE